MRKDTGYLDSVGVFDVLNHTFSFARALVICICLTWGIWVLYGLFAHWNGVYTETHALLAHEYGAKQHLVDTFCNLSPQHAATSDCVSATKYLSRSLLLRSYEETIQEHLDHLPFVAHCRTTSDCSHMLYTITEMVRGSFWWFMMVVGVFVGYACMHGIRVSFKRFWKTWGDYNERQEARLPEVVRPKQL